MEGFSILGMSKFATGYVVGFIMCFIFIVIPRLISKSN